MDRRRRNLGFMGDQAMTLEQAVKEAHKADAAWQAKLDACGVDRWSADARGKPGTVLRNLYEMKVLADQLMSEAFTRSRTAP